MKEIICPACGSEILIADENVGVVQCKCGNVIQNYNLIYGKPGFRTEVNVEKLKAEQLKRSKKAFTAFLIVINFFILFSIAMLVFLVKNVNSTIPLFTIPPVTIFMIIGEIIFCVNFKKTMARFK